MAELIRWGERLFLIPLSALVVMRVAPQIAAHPYLAIFLISELVGVFLLLTQRRGEWTVDLFPIAIAFLGTCVALLVTPQGVKIAPDGVSFALVCGGGLIALAAKLFLGRSFGIVAANRGVKHHGVYRWVRHPMYAGYILNQLGFLLAFFSLGNVLIYAVAWTCFWLRAVEEEKFLRKDPAYCEYAGNVRYRLIPGIA